MAPGLDLLLCTLGTSWAVVPEVYGWLAPGVLDLYRHHPERAELDRQRELLGLRPPQEIWVLTTDSERTTRALEQLQRWHACLRSARPAPLRVWRAAHTGELASEEQCRRMRELILRCALMAAEYAGADGQLVLSLAGGRKTMSADLQRAGSVFGCTALVHVLDTGELPSLLREPAPTVLAAPLPATAVGPAGPEDCARRLRPVVIGSAMPSELLQVRLEQRPAVSTREFPLPLAEGHAVRWEWQPGAQASLADEVALREREGSRLLYSYMQQLARGERHQGWRMLFRLPPTCMDRLRSTKLAPRHLGWLRRLPKADLHCHIGGALQIAQQRQVARAIWEASPPGRRTQALERVESWLRQPRWPADWPAALRRLEPLRAECAAALLLYASDAQLEENLFGSTEPRIALAERAFALYEQPGELSGSAVLGHPAALPVYAKAIVDNAVADGVWYLELRGSPQRYAPQQAIAWLRRLQQCLRQAQQGVQQPLEIRFVVIADRRLPEQIEDVVRLAASARAQLGDFVVGVDLAGDEKSFSPAEVAPRFNPAFEACLRITVHAGEGQAPQNVWEAAYHLHADRIGHGLSLAEHPRLMERFRDREICVELCPSSNYEVVGFCDPEHPESLGRPTYPLRVLWEAGVPVAVCTDNPGISRTTLSQEYLRAARMVGGLTLWEVTALAHCGFRHAFVPAAERERLLRLADQALFALCLQPDPEQLSETEAD
ncbi:MAG: hypothetical protein KatS3mg102_1933 [Planctomycetota bacterium]|nr:MAG: hypothetical protein KatS3mg102_1933 [Planctomycetota bacterium]